MQYQVDATMMGEGFDESDVSMFCGILQDVLEEHGVGVDVMEIVAVDDAWTEAVNDDEAVHFMGDGSFLEALARYARDEWI